MRSSILPVIQIAPSMTSGRKMRSRNLHHPVSFSALSFSAAVYAADTSRAAGSPFLCIQNQIVDALGTVDRGVKGAKPGVNGLYVLSNTDAVAVLVELAFIDHAGDAELLGTQQDEFARAIARGVTDYEGEC